MSPSGLRRSCSTNFRCLSRRSGSVKGLSKPCWSIGIAAIRDNQTSVWARVISTKSQHLTWSVQLWIVKKHGLSNQLRALVF